jgi:hypothetical protein
MSRFELSISDSYVSHWGLWEAFREIMQNCIDQATKPGCDLFTNFDSATQTLIMGNLNSSLRPETLLLGLSDKASSIHLGKYGEGYKLALLVMLRLGLRVEILNPPNFVWTPRIVRSRKFGNYRIITIETSKLPGEKFTSLSYSISGISAYDFATLMQKCIHGLDSPNFSTPHGRILLNEEFSGKLFAGGLFICSMPESLKYGYDFAPGVLELDRDRNKTDSFNTMWETSRLWAEAGTEAVGKLHDLIKLNADDIKFFQSHMHRSSDLYRDLASLSYSEFILKHGKFAVPCEHKEHADMISKRYNSLVPVVLPTTHYQFISSSESWLTSEQYSKMKSEDENKTPYRILRDYIAGARIKFSLPDSFIEDFNATVLQNSLTWSERISK